MAVTLMDTPLAVFRAAGGVPAVVLDRCGHRNYPLSLGRVTGDGLLECGYHGWTFDGGGRCVRVPGLRHGRTQATWHVPSHATVEQDGFVWAWGEPDSEPTRPPLALPVVDGPGAGEAVFRCDLDATLRAALENALDVPHTAFLHRGFFRGGAPRTITAVRRPIEGGVEVQYLGEPVRMGPIRLPKDSGRTFDHWDRFLLPSSRRSSTRRGVVRIVNTISICRSHRSAPGLGSSSASPRPPAPLCGRPYVSRAGASSPGRRRAGSADRADPQLRRRALRVDRARPPRHVIWRLLRQAERSERPDGESLPLATISEREVVFEA